jgi:WD40 repeat protein
VACSPDGKTVATAAGDHTVRLWDRATGQESRSLDTSPVDVEHVRFAPDGRRLVAAGSDHSRVAPGRPAVGKVLLWDLQTGKKVLETPDESWAGRAPGEPVLGKRGTLIVGRHEWAFEANGKPGGTMVCKSSAVLVLDAGTGKVVQEWAGRGQPARCLALSGDERVLAWGGDGRVRVVDLASGKELRFLAVGGTGEKNAVTAVAFSADGKLLAAGAAGGAVAAWEWASGRQVHAFACPNGGSHPTLAFVGGGRLLVAAGTGARSEDEDALEIRVWDAGTGRPVAGPFRAASSPSVLAFAPDGTFLAAGYYSPAALLWDLAGALGAAQTPATSRPPQTP